jgi:tubulin beta
LHDIGSGGKHCGDNDAQLGRINVFYHEASGGKYVARTVFFEPGMIDAVRASPLGELYTQRPREPKRGQKLGQGPLQKG